MACASQLKGCNIHVYERARDGFKRISAFDHPHSPHTKPVIRVLYGGGVHYGALSSHTLTHTHTLTHSPTLTDSLTHPHSQTHSLTLTEDSLAKVVTQLRAHNNSTPFLFQTRWSFDRDLSPSSQFSTSLGERALALRISCCIVL